MRGDVVTLSNFDAADPGVVYRLTLRLPVCRQFRKFLNKVRDGLTRCDQV
jgi:hypothetical protein